MTCKCGYQNHADAKYCGGCGRKLHHGEGISKKWLAIAAACLLITGIGIGNLLSGWGTPAGERQQKNSLQDLIVKKDVEITQVLPVEDGSVAVHYSDGTVRVSENSPFWGAILGWSDVERLYYNVTYDWTDGEMLEYPALFGLTKDGSVLCTDGKLSGWSNVKELHFTWQGIVGVTYDGRVLAEGDWENPSVLTGLTDVEYLLTSNYSGVWGCLKKDGSVEFISDSAYVETYASHWRNVKELRASDHGYYAIMKDGTVEGQFDDTYVGLRGAAKVVAFEDWLFGISSDGQLLTHSGGNIYLNAGDLAVADPGSHEYGGEVDISRFNQVKDIVTFRGLILLNKDGTVQFLGAYPEWDFRDWYDIQKVYGVWDKEGIVEKLYGIRQDGSVIVNQYDQSTSNHRVIDQYRGWKLKDMYCAEGGVIGLTTDGELVGDGIYENVDFSVFDS